jgi:REP element-mobilizing transposase RayT
MYFVTICTFQRQCLFGEIVAGETRLNELGQIVVHEWLRSQDIRQEIDFDAWVIMPNHIHGIVVIHPPNTPQSSDTQRHPVGANGRSPLHGIAFQPMKPRSLSSFIAGFKSATTKQINLIRNAPGTPVWQRNYYDHIIRNEISLEHLRAYIHNNPLSWQEDPLHPDVDSNW